MLSSSQFVQKRLSQSGVSDDQTVEFFYSISHYHPPCRETSVEWNLTARQNRTEKGLWTRPQAARYFSSFSNAARATEILATARGASYLKLFARSLARIKSSLASKRTKEARSNPEVLSSIHFRPLRVTKGTLRFDSSPEKLSTAFAALTASAATSQGRTASAVRNCRAMSIITRARLASSVSTRRASARASSRVSKPRARSALRSNRPIRV